MRATDEIGANPADTASRDGSEVQHHLGTLPPAFHAYAEEPLEQAPAGGPGKNGLLSARFARDGAGDDDTRTRLVYDRVEVPYHLTGTVDTDPAPGLTTVLAQEPTGGVAQGDRHRLSIDVGSDARAHVTTQSATKVHSMGANFAHLDVTLRAETGAHLEYVPGSTILNRDARCCQTTRVDVAEDAVVIVTDVLVPGGLSDHEPFDFDHYYASVEATDDGRVCCADVVDLRPDERDPRDPASVGEYDVVGSVYVFAPSEDVPALSDRVHERLTDRTDVLAGVSTLPYESGIVVRILGQREADVTASVRDAWDETRRSTLGVGAPADRRY